MPQCPLPPRSRAATPPAATPLPPRPCRHAPATKPPAATPPAATPPTATPLPPRARASTSRVLLLGQEGITSPRRYKARAQPCSHAKQLGHSPRRRLWQVISPSQFLLLGSPDDTSRDYRRVKSDSHIRHLTQEVLLNRERLPAPLWATQAEPRRPQNTTKARMTCRRSKEVSCS
ncbi:unnamed protein product [Rangifer tarandus platyrhynchus]|uniref:Uncharacterized protein n=1 Tax=Rangifer tarandus platyrhynchus TaxID=3082113 RepID=A0AC59Y3W1_RANTA